MTYISRNPYTNELYQEFSLQTKEEAIELTHQLVNQYKVWKHRSLNERVALVRNISNALGDKKQELAILMTEEMGKPVQQSIAEIKKCIWLVEHFCDRAEQLLKHPSKTIDGYQAGVRRDPIGIVLGIMPWNYPFWQVFRYTIPSLLVGNAVLLKHAPNVPRSAKAMEDSIRKAIGIDIFTNLNISTDDVPALIDHFWVRGVAVTGSVRAGSAVAAVAGEKIIPTVLELGSNDPFIILEDADIDEAAHTFIDARFTNTGQTCIAAKRLIVQASVAEKVRTILYDRIQNLRIGNPLEGDFDLSCMARIDLAEHLWQQWSQSAPSAQKVHIEAQQEGTLFRPGFIENPAFNSPAWREELFGPVAVMASADSVEDCLAMANDTVYGLGASVWTGRQSTAEHFIRNLDYGTVSVNQKVSSDPRLPFGGFKQSGYGRELGDDGFLEFTNTKTFWLPKGLQ